MRSSVAILPPHDATKPYWKKRAEHIRHRRLNAIEWQAEIGRGDAETIHHLGLALLAFARSLSIDPESTGIAQEVAPLLQELRGGS